MEKLIISQIMVFRLLIFIFCISTSVLCKSEIFISRVQNVSSSGVCDGKVTVVVSGTAGPFEISWPGGFVSDIMGEYTIPFGFCSGAYKLSVEDKTGCEKSLDFVIRECNHELENLFVEAEVMPLTSASSSDGKIMLAANTTKDVIISWAGPDGFTSNKFVLNGLSSGLYTAVISNGCEVIEREYEIKDCSDINVFAIYTEACQGKDDGGIRIFFEPGYLPISMIWRDIESTAGNPPRFPLTEGNALQSIRAGDFYNVEIDFGVCSISRTLELLQKDPEYVNATFCRNVEFCRGMPVDTVLLSFSSQTLFRSDATCFDVRSCENGTADVTPRARVEMLAYDFPSCWGLFRCTNERGRTIESNGDLYYCGPWFFTPCGCVWENIGLSVGAPNVSADNQEIDTLITGTNWEKAPVNLLEKEPHSSISVFPNPFTETLNFEFGEFLGMEKQSLSFQLFNILGISVFEESIHLSKTDQNGTLDVSQLLPGWYILNVFSDKKTIYQTNLLKVSN